MENLQKFWTLKEVRAFHRLTEENLSLLKSRKALSPCIGPNSQVRRMVIHPNVTLYYRVEEAENCIYLITFFNNRMNPDLLKELLDSQ